MVLMGCNSRLDTFQAVVGNWLIPQTESIAANRIKNAAYYDSALRKIEGITIPPRPADFRIVYHLYIVFAKDRDGLLAYCQARGIEAKVHYPVPIYRQPALEHLGHKMGDFPVTDAHAEKIITFPCDQHLNREQMDTVIDAVRKYYE